MNNLDQFLNIKELEKWKRFALRKELSKREGRQTKLPGFYDLVYVSKSQKSVVDPLSGDKSLAIYTSMPNEGKYEGHMFGEFVYSHCQKTKITSILIDPYISSFQNIAFTAFSEVVFAPIKDEFTGQYLICEPAEAKALFALNPKDLKRFGVELVFYMLTNRDLPDSYPEREAILQNKIEELAFLAPRVPVAKGSGSFIAAILNLEHPMEESAFMRTYKTYESYMDLVFVNSNLEMRSGEFERIDYDGDQIDNILTPLVAWQLKKKKGTERNFF